MNLKSEATIIQIRLKIAAFQFELVVNPGRAAWLSLGAWLLQHHLKF